MLKLTIAAMAAVLLTPAVAHAGTFKGTVVAKEAGRQVLVVTTRHGDVMSARVTPRQLRGTRLGTRLVLVGKRAADGSVHVTRLERLGTAKRARVHVVVVKAKGRRLLVAGGGSAFSIRLAHGTRLLAGEGSVHPGEKVDAEVELSGATAVGETLHATGEAPLIEFSGVVTAMDATTFTVSREGIDTVVQLPDGVVLPQLVHVGSEVEVVAAISGSTLTLTTIKLDGSDSAGDHGGCNSDDQGHVGVEGFVTALDAGSITIQPGNNASPATFAIPNGFTLPDGLKAGSAVEAHGEMVAGVLTLKRLELRHENGGDGDLEAEGAVTALDSGSITIQSWGSAVTFSIPDGFTLPSGLAVGSFVEAHGTTSGAVATLTRIELKSEDGGRLRVEGTVTALDGGSITVQSGDNPNPLTFAIPDGFTLPAGVVVGSAVEARGEYVNGVLTLRQIELQS